MVNSDNDRLFEEMALSITKLDKARAEQLAIEAIENEVNLYTVIDTGFGEGIRRAGELWEQGEFFLPELMMSAEIMKTVMGRIIPQLEKQHNQVSESTRIVIGTVQGDIHDIGKTLVATMMQASGFDVVDLGADVSHEKFIDTAIRESAHMICMSALLTTTMVGQRTVIETLDRRGLRKNFLVMVGGAPVTGHWAAEIGADCFASNAVSAVSIARSQLSKQ
jgi:trimethylamine corrinoid protein